MTMLSVFKSLFSSTVATNAAVDIIRNVTNTDGLTDKEKAQFVLDYLKATSHQSVPRRVLALGFFTLYTIFCLTWLGMFFFTSGEQLDFLSAFIQDMLTQPLNIIVGFYFTMSIIKGLNK